MEEYKQSLSRYQSQTVSEWVPYPKLLWHHLGRSQTEFGSDSKNFTPCFTTTYYSDYMRSRHEVGVAVLCHHWRSMAVMNMDLNFVPCENSIYNPASLSMKQMQSFIYWQSLKYSINTSPTYTHLRNENLVKLMWPSPIAYNYFPFVCILRVVRHTARGVDHT